jgi:endo-1,4-beta-xylanase
MQRLAHLSSLCLLSFGLSACSDGGGSRPTDPAGPGVVPPNPSATGTPGVEVPPGATLRTMADPMQHLIGVAVRTSRLSDTRYTGAVREFNSLTHENEMKWDTIEPQPGVFNWTAADQTIAFAEQNGMQVRGHTLVWHSQIPQWVRDLATRDDALLAMERHITEVVSRYKGRIFAYDVVNEAFTDGNFQAMTPPRLRGSDPADATDPNNANGNSGNDSPFRRLIGEDYIDRAFIAANAADPDAKLFYNDYSADGAGPKSDAIYAMAQGMLQRGVPIHGIGLQMHLGTNAGGNTSPEAIAANMQRIADLGLEVHITELDVSICRGMITDVAERRRLQRERLASITQTCLAQPACTALTVWGVGDSDSWRDDECQGGGRSEPLLFDSNYQRKDAYFGVFDAFAAVSPAAPIQ